MGYEDFVWFILSEEDKTNDVSLEYWFRQGPRCAAQRMCQESWLLVLPEKDLPEFCDIAFSLTYVCLHRCLDLDCDGCLRANEMLVRPSACTGSSVEQPSISHASFT